MDAIISKQFKKYGALINDEIFEEIGTYINFRRDRVVNPYFFFKSELDIPRIVGRKTADTYAKYVELKKESIRHLIPYKKGYFDYTTQKEYTTLGEWAADNGKTVDDICYGRLDVHFIPEIITKADAYWFRPTINYITLNQLLKTIDPNWDTIQTVDIEVLEEAITPERQATVDRVNAILEQINTLRISVEALCPV